MAKKSSSFLSIITAISIGGVCVGVLTMIVTLSVMSGFSHELKSKLFAAQEHILIEKKDDSYFKGGAALAARVRKASPLIRKVYPVLQTEVILRAGKRVTGSILKGAQKEQMSWVKAHVDEWAPDQLLAQTTDARIFLGSEMAYDLGIIPGDMITIVSPVESDGPFGAIPRVKRFIVQGIYKTGVPEQELNVVFTKARNVESFLRQAGILSRIEVRVRSLDDAPVVAGVLAKELGPSYLVRPWQQLNAHLFKSLKLERTAMFCILIFIVIVASFNIVSTLTMMVLEKKRSLSILRAMGATRKQVSSIFLWEGLAIGIFGVSSGAGVGLFICWLLSKYPVIELPDVFYDRTLPVLVQPAAVAIVVGAALAIVLIGAAAPARKAALLPPIQGIREG